jgi:hypothetical protein
MRAISSSIIPTSNLVWCNNIMRGAGRPPSLRLQLVSAPHTSARTSCALHKPQRLQIPRVNKCIYIVLMHSHHHSIILPQHLLF